MLSGDEKNICRELLAARMEIEGSRVEIECSRVEIEGSRVEKKLFMYVFKLIKNNMVLS
jgi:hypothetical protein